MKSLLFFLLAALACTAAAESVVQRFGTGDFAENVRHGEEIVVDNIVAEEVTFQLLHVDAPKIDSRWYAIVGEVKYAGIEGTGFLEMWSHFAGGGAFFSRTLAASGPMAALRGSSTWREFTVPFDAAGATGAPERLVLNLHAPGHTRLELREVRLMRLDAAGFATATSTGAGKPWWSGRSGALVGGIGGALLGCFGSLAEWLVSRGKSRRFVLAGVRSVIALGALALGGGVIALASRQPYGVWYALLLLGALCVLIMPVRLRRYEERYRDCELRRMQALDAV